MVLSDVHWQIPQVVLRIEAVVAAKPSSQAFTYGDFPQTVMGLPEAPAALLDPPVLPLAVAATGAPSSGPHQYLLPLNGTTNAPASSGEGHLFYAHFRELPDACHEPWICCGSWLRK